MTRRPISSLRPGASPSDWDRAERDPVREALRDGLGEDYGTTLYRCAFKGCTDVFIGLDYLRQHQARENHDEGKESR